MNEQQDSMRPKPGDRLIKIPITFSRRAEGNMNIKTLITSLLVSTGVFAILTLLTLKGNLVWYLKYPTFALVLYGYVYFLRFFILLEGRKSDAYETLLENDLSLGSDTFWNIYSVSKKRPYTVHFMNGMKGIFVQMDKDIIVGKPDNMSFNHFEGIAEMYREAHELKLSPISIDYMDNVGNDPRMNKVHAVASRCENPVLKGVLTEMYANLEREMELDYNSFDVYLFASRGSEEDLWYKVRQVADVGKQQANYTSYSLFPPEQLRKFTQLTLNLDEFSMLKAQRTALESETRRAVRPIELIKVNGEVEHLGKTLQELEEERNNLKNRKREVRKDEVIEDYLEDVDELNLFEPSTILDEGYEYEDQGTQTDNNKDKKKKEDKDIDFF